MIVSQRPGSDSGVNAGTSCMNSAMGPVTEIPMLSMAETCSVTVSTKVISWPARARKAPSVPPMAPAPQTRNRISVRSGAAPRAGEKRARLLDRDLPECEHVLVGALIQPAVVAVADIAPHAHRVERAHARQVEHG